MDGQIARAEGAHQQDRVAVVDLADELQAQKQWLFKIIKKLRIVCGSVRDADRRNQNVATVSRLEAEQIRQEVETSRTRQASSIHDEGEEIDAEVGFFYVVQLEPKHDPGRVKVGYTIELDGRIRKHRCSAPYAGYAKWWPCRRLWERTAIDCVTFELEQLHTEVFRASSIDKLIERGDRFFAAMPSAQPRNVVPEQP